MREQRDLMAVDPRLLKEFLLDELDERAKAISQSPLASYAEEAIASQDEHIAVARAGYCTRIAETERFERARSDMPWLRELLGARDGARSAVAQRLAADEPAGKPAPTDPSAMTWKVPGPGGHVRYFLATRQAGGDERARLAWLYGFFLRCCDEVMDGLYGR